MKLSPGRGWTALTLTALAAAALAGCGKQGDLERPAPLFHHTLTPSAQTLTREQAADRARADGADSADPQAPQSVDEVRNQRVAPRPTPGLSAPAASSTPPAPQ